MPRILTYEAAGADEGRLVRDVIREDFRLVAHDTARAKYRTENGITVDGVPVRVNHPLHPGNVLRVVLSDEPPVRIVPAEGPLAILYEDEDVICINKPAGTVVHPSHGHFSDTIANYLAFYFEQKGEPREIRTVGRLDKDTSGILVFGKNRTACAHLTEQAEKGTRRKRYLALAHGVFGAPEGEIDAPIEREFAGLQKRVVREGGDEAHTSWKVAYQFPDFALVEAEIATSRTHQIRVHLTHIGHPLVGDRLYGPEYADADAAIGLTRAALHAHRLDFAQPFTGERIALCAPVPADMRGALARFLPEEELRDLP